MDTCIFCTSEDIVSISGKTVDCFALEYKGQEYDGYVPEGIGLGEGGDYIELKYCLDCGRIQDSFPKTEKKIRRLFDEEDDLYTDEED